jgi:limonene-1,2-epoxide hydrolase
MDTNNDNEANDALVREFLVKWAQRDTDWLVAICTEDAVWHHRPLEPIVGREAIRSFCERFKDVPGGPYEILAQVASERLVMNERLDQVTVGDKLLSLPACGVFDIEGGRITGWRDYFDTSGLIERHENQGD